MEMYKIACQLQCSTTYFLGLGKKTIKLANILSLYWHVSLLFLQFRYLKANLAEKGTLIKRGVFTRVPSKERDREKGRRGLSLKINSRQKTGENLFWPLLLWAISRLAIRPLCDTAFMKKRRYSFSLWEGGLFFPFSLNPRGLDPPFSSLETLINLKTSSALNNVSAE